MASGIFNISAELLRAIVKAMTGGLTDVWQSDTIPHDWKVDLVVLIL